jgi:HK97 family phage portal protein
LAKAKKAPAKKRVGEPMAVRRTAPKKSGGSDVATAIIESFQFNSHSSGAINDYDLPLTAQSAMGCPAVTACVKYISDALAECVANVFELGPNSTKKKINDHPLYWLLNEQPNPEMSAFDFRSAIGGLVLLHGNAYVEIERDAYGRVVHLWLIGGPERITPARTNSGNLVYVADQERIVLDPSQVLHFRGFSLNGVDGLSVIAQNRPTIKLAKLQEAYGAEYFSRGPRPGGLLSIQGKPTEAERKQLIESFEKNYSGPKNAGRTMLMFGGAEWHSTTMSNDDAQWVLGRGFQDEQIARLFGVPPSLIGITGKSSYASQEQDAIMFVRGCLRPWAARFEQEINRKILYRSNRQVRLDMSRQQQGDSVSLATMINSLVTCGVYQVNEARDVFDLNPVENGDVTLVQGAQITLERAVEGAPVSPLPTPSGVPPNEEAEEEVEDEEAQDEAVARLFTGAFARILRVAGDKAERAQKKGELAEHIQSFFGPVNVQFAAAEISPILNLWALTARQLDPANVPAAAKAIAEEYDAAYLRETQSGNAAKPDDQRPVRFAQRAVEIAKEHLKRVVG